MRPKDPSKPRLLVVLLCLSLFLLMWLAFKLRIVEFLGALSFLAALGLILFLNLRMHFRFETRSEEEADRTLIFEENYRGRSLKQRPSIYEDVLFLRNSCWGEVLNESIPYDEITQAQRLEEFFMLYVAITGKSDGETWTRRFRTENAGYILELLAERGVNVDASQSVK